MLYSSFSYIFRFYFRHWSLKVFKHKAFDVHLNRFTGQFTYSIIYTHSCCSIPDGISVCPQTQNVVYQNYEAAFFNAQMSKKSTVALIHFTVRKITALTVCSFRVFFLRDTRVSKQNLNFCFDK